MPHDRPNILLFLTDDHAPWALGCYGNTEVCSPVLDRLASEGALCTNAFTPCPVCSPARASLMTGRTNSQVGIHDWIYQNDPRYEHHDWLADDITLPELLSREGYLCGLSGKWHLGQTYKTPRGFTWYFGQPGAAGAHRGASTYVYDDQPLALRGSHTELITKYALEFLQRVPEDTPFLLVVGYVATHSPYTGQDPDLVARYDGATFGDIPNYTPHPWHKNEDFPQGDAYSHEDIVIRHKNYYAAVTDVDRHIGQIRDALRASGRREATLLIYTSDHGLALGHHGYWGKGNGTRPLNMYEVSIRVPLILHYPAEIPPGRTVRRCVDHYDTFQTVCDFAGVSLETQASTLRAYPGRSYRALTRGEDLPTWRDTRFGEYGDLRMIRTPRYKLVRRYPNGPDDLFDVYEDPGETRNLAELPDYGAIRASLLEELERFYAGHEDPAKSGLRVKELRSHNFQVEAWRDGIREARGLQVY